MACTVRRAVLTNHGSKFIDLMKELHIYLAPLAESEEVSTATALHRSESIDFQ